LTRRKKCVCVPKGKIKDSKVSRCASRPFDLGASNHDVLLRPLALWCLIFWSLFVFFIKLMTTPTTPTATPLICDALVTGHCRLETSAPGFSWSYLCCPFYSRLRTAVDFVHSSTGTVVYSKDTVSVSTTMHPRIF